MVAMGATFPSRWQAEKARFDDQPIDPDTYGKFLAGAGTVLNDASNVVDAVPDMVQDAFSTKKPRYEMREATFPLVPQTMATARNAVQGVFTFRPLSSIGDVLSIPGKFDQDIFRLLGAGKDSQNHVILRHAA